MLHNMKPSLALKSRFSKDIRPSELALLQHFLSNDYVANMDRCFGSAHSAPIGDDFKLFLKRIFVNENFNSQPLTIPEDKESYSSLQKAGILVELADATTFMFSSLLGKEILLQMDLPKPLIVDACVSPRTCTKRCRIHVIQRAEAFDYCWGFSKRSRLPTFVHGRTGSFYSS